MNHTSFIQDPWLSEIMQREVFRLAIDHTSFSSNDIYKELSTLPTRSFVYFKVPADAVKAVQSLCHLGFYLVNTNVILDKEIIQPFSFENKSNQITYRLAKPEEEDAIAKLAVKELNDSRFHFDHEIETLLAQKIKELWIRNFFRGKRGKYMAVAVDSKNQVIGFNQVLTENDGTMVIDQIAVSEPLHGKGVAEGLVNFPPSIHPAARTYLVGTQISNIRAVRFYQKQGFRLKKADHILHFHKR